MNYNKIWKIKGLFFVFAVLIGCTTSQISNFKMASMIVEINKQNKNKYDNAKQVIAPISGIWTNKAQDGVTSIKLNLDGAGVLCLTSSVLSENQDRFYLFPIKYLANNTLLAQNGQVFKFKNKDVLVLEYDAYLRDVIKLKELSLKSDNDLKLTSIACREKLE